MQPQLASLPVQGHSGAHLLSRLFLEHPQEVGENYWDHQRQALSFALPMICAGIACLVHALVPGLFVRTGSRTIAHLHERMVLNRVRSGARRAADPHREA